MRTVERVGVLVAITCLLGTVPAAFGSEPQLVPLPPEAAEAQTATVEEGAAQSHSVVADQGFEGGVRAEVGRAFGDSGNGHSMADELDFRGGVWLDLGYRLSPTWTVGGMLQGGWGGATCLGSFSSILGASPACSFTDLRVGLEAQYRFDRPQSGAWLGFGVGYLQVLQRWQGQVTVPTTSTGGSGAATTAASVTLKEVKDGPFLLLQGGWDWKIDGFLSGGPYAAYHLAGYTGAGYECTSPVSCPGSADLGGPGPSHWFSIGLRAVIAP